MLKFFIHGSKSLIIFYLKLLIDNFMAAVQRVKLEVRPLFLPQLVRLVNMLTPGLTQLSWVNAGWKPFIQNVNSAIENFSILVSYF